MSSAGRDGRMGKSDHGGKIVYELRAAFHFNSKDDAEFARKSFEKQWGTGKLLFDAGRLDAVEVRTVAIGGYAGRSLIERIEDQLRKQVLKLGAQQDSEKIAVFKARCEGLAWALGVLRSSSMKYEMDRASE